MTHAPFPLLATTALPPDWHASSTLEKVLEHRLLALLTTALWLRGERQLEVLRGEVDEAGYDLVLEVRRILRHLQLKARRRGGKRRDVSINIRLAGKPSGCVVWFEYDPDTLDLGPFYWFGGAPGEPLPPLGEKIALHAKGNSEGLKLARPGHRIVKETAFTRLETIDALVEALFGGAQGHSASSHAREAGHLAILRQHLKRYAHQTVPAGPADPHWLAAAREGDFRALPDLDWDHSATFAHLIQGFELVREAGLGDLQDFCEAAHLQAARTGEWHGTALELWVMLFGEHRRARQASFGADDATKARLDALCWTLVARLKGA